MRRVEPVVIGLCGVVLAGCTGGGPSVRPPTAAASSGVSSWQVYRQPKGPMQLTFRYPPGWRTAGRTFMASMGNVGGAEVIGGTSATFAAFRSAGTCASRIALVGKGVYIAWGENIGGPSPIKLSARLGDPLRVNGHPARLADTTSTNCFGLHGRVLSGTIQVATNRFLFMNALIGKGAPAEMVSQVRDLFASARR